MSSHTPFSTVFAFSIISLMALAGGCATAPTPTAEIDAHDCDGVNAAASDPVLDKIITDLDGQQFRSLPYLQLAVALQTMPHAQAENQLRVWACSEKHDLQVFCLCRLLFVGRAGQPLASPPVLDRIYFDTKPMTEILNFVDRPDQYKPAVGGTNATRWPDWPLAMAYGVPFFIAVEPVPPLSSMVYPQPYAPPRSLASGYLARCLKDGQWTAYQYQIANLDARQQALDALLHSAKWQRNPTDAEVKLLTYQTSEQAAAVEPKPIYWPDDTPRQL